MNARRRYDTTALIQDLKADRRKGIGLVVAAVLVGVVLIAVYISQIGIGAPGVPGSADPLPASPEERAEAIDDAIADDAESKAEDVEPTPAKVSVEVVLPRKGTLLVDDAAVGKGKTHEVELDAGPHTFAMKIGKRTLEHTEELEEGTRVQITFKRKRAVSKVTPLAETTDAEVDSESVDSAAKE